MKKPSYSCHGLDPMENPSKASLPGLSELDILEMHDFGKTVLTLALPVMLQSLISAAVNYADVWMLSCISQSAMSAASQANQITFLLTLIYLGLSTGVTILTAQYWGNRNLKAIEQISGLAVKLSMGASILFFLLTQLAPGILMKLYTPDETLIALGKTYLRIVGIGYLATGLSQMLLASMKSMEQVNICSAISIGSLICNIVLNAVSIFLLFPENAPLALGGVAAATTIARILEAGCCLVWIRKKSPVKLRLRHILRSEPWLKIDFRRCTAQVQLNYLIWGGALSAITALVGYVSSDMVSAYAAANSLKNLAIVVCTGVSTAGGILLGKFLGSGRLALAKAAGDKLCRWSLLLGTLAGGILLLIRPLCLSSLSLNEDAALLLDGMLLISALYCIGKSFNSTLVGGIFCAGGDTRFGLICDTIAMWGVILPVGWFCAFRLQIEPIWIFLVLSLDEFIKMPFVAAHYRKYKWIQNLTHSDIQEET